MLKKKDFLFVSWQSNMAIAQTILIKNYINIIGLS